MSVMVAVATVLLWSGTPDHRRDLPLIRNPVLLNMGFVCKWQNACIGRQQRAMRSSLAYVKTQRIPAWKIRLCNRNASRGGTRKDWVGFNNCIRNPRLRPKG